MKKVYVSPSDQTQNIYAAGNTNEATQCRQIAILLVEALARSGVEGRTNLTASMAERVQESNAWGADVHVCLHTNAYPEKEGEREVSGTRIFCYELGGAGNRACIAVMARLAPITPGTSDNITARPELYECRVASAPTVYVEIDFHDVAEVALWIIGHKADIAEAIAHGLCDYFAIPYAAPQMSGKRYRTLGDVRADKEVAPFYLPTLEQLIAQGALKGKGGTGDALILDLSEDAIRLLVILNRLQLFEN